MARIILEMSDLLNVELRTAVFNYLTKNVDAVQVHGEGFKVAPEDYPQFTAPQNSGSAAPSTVGVVPLPIVPEASPGFAPPQSNVIPIVPGAPPVVPAATTIPPAPAHSVEVDSEGLPWDARIHSSSKARVQKDNSWKLARGVSQQLVVTVKAELRQAMAAPATRPAPVPVPPGAPSQFAAPAPVPVPPPTTSAVPPPPVVPDNSGFATFMQRALPKLTDGRWSENAKNTVLGALGLASVADLAVRPDLIPAFEAMMPQV